MTTKHRIVPCLALIALAILLAQGAAIHANGSGDILIYAATNFDGDATYFRYDPHTDSQTAITTTAGLTSISVSVDGRIALSSCALLDTCDHGITVVDAGNAPMQINPDTAPYSYSLGWRPDGQFLAFSAGQSEDEHQLYVWNATTAALTLLGDFPGIAYAAWSPDSRWLAYSTGRSEDDYQLYVWDSSTTTLIAPGDHADITGPFVPVWRPNKSGSDNLLAFSATLGNDAEIFVWDGTTITNISQNPDTADTAPMWSSDGQLAFHSRTESEYAILIWDGVSTPGPDSVTEVAPGMIGYYSSQTWTPTGLLTFISQGPDDTHAQIYLWDGQTATNISQNPDLHNGLPVWSADGRWAFATFFSSEQLLYVRDQDNNTLLETEGQYPAWSSDGLLAYCARAERGWQLNLWDGERITQVAEAQTIQAQWQQSGTTVTCSSG